MSWVLLRRFALRRVLEVMQNILENNTATSWSKPRGGIAIENSICHRLAIHEMKRHLSLSTDPATITIVITKRTHYFSALTYRRKKTQKELQSVRCLCSLSRTSEYPYRAYIPFPTEFDEFTLKHVHYILGNHETA
jgi:hypothetical protein